MRRRKGAPRRDLLPGALARHIGGFDSAGPAREEKQQEKERRRSRMERKKEEKECVREGKREVCLTVARLAAQPLVPLSLSLSLSPKPSPSRS